MAKLRERPSLPTRRASISRRSRRTQNEWNVEMSGLASEAWPMSLSTRSAISPAALFVKVTARMESGATPRWSISQAMRWVMTRVLPDPAPARINTAPSTASTASRCWGFSLSRRCCKRSALSILIGHAQRIMTTMALLEATGLSKSYGPTRVVDDVSFRIERGETLGLVGESGSGKSTIARMVLGLIEPTAGTVVFDGHPMTGVSTGRLRPLRRRMQPVFQDPYAALNPRMRVEQIVTEPLVIHERQSAEQRRARCRELLRQVGLDESAMRRFPHEFSGGQRQRINIARALALRPDMLVLDEPVSALDVSVGAQIVNLLRELQREFQLTYLFISHSMPLVRYLSTNIAVLRRGKLVEYGARDAICQSPQDAYTQALLAATPELRLGMNQ